MEKKNSLELFSSHCAVQALGTRNLEYFPSIGKVPLPH